MTFGTKIQLLDCFLLMFAAIMWWESVHGEPWWYVAIWTLLAAWSVYDIVTRRGGEYAD